MKISMWIPIDIDDRVEFQNAAAAKAMARGMEAAGVDACFITDHPAPAAAWRRSGGHDALDPFAGLAFVAAATETLRLHTNLVVLPYRNPFLTAKSVATLDVLSEGRLILGCGVGYLEGEYQALGVDYSARGALMDEAIETMKAAWSGEEVARRGRGFNAPGNLPRPLPVQDPHPPIWSGGNSDRAVRRAGELCDGWSPMFASEEMGKRARTDAITSHEDLKVKIDLLRGHLSRVGRSRAYDVCIGPRTPIKACSRDEAQRVIEELGQLARLGVSWTYMGLPHPTRAAFLENVQWFGEEVAPKVHEIATPGISWG
jgi:probable F420-dependent oxidoreductase